MVCLNILENLCDIIYLFPQENEDEFSCFLQSICMHTTVSSSVCLRQCVFIMFIFIFVIIYMMAWRCLWTFHLCGYLSIKACNRRVASVRRCVMHCAKTGTSFKWRSFNYIIYEYCRLVEWKKPGHWSSWFESELVIWFRFDCDFSNQLIPRYFR